MDSNLNNRLVAHCKKRSLFCVIQYVFRSSRSTLDVLTVVSDRLARAFDSSGTWYVTVALDISKGFYRVWHAGLLQKLISYGISTAWKVSKYVVFPGPYFAVFGLNTVSVQIQENTDQKKLRVWTLFTQCSGWPEFSGWSFHGNNRLWLVFPPL